MTCGSSTVNRPMSRKPLYVVTEIMKPTVLRTARRVTAKKPPSEAR